MQKHLENLERLKAKYQSRYGREDDLVVSLQESLDARRKAASKRLRWGSHHQRPVRQIASRLAGLI